MAPQSFNQLLRLLLRRKALRERPYVFALVAALLLALNLPWRDWLRPWFAPSADCTLERVLDGDTVKAICDGKKTRIRFYCIDAPEMSQRPWGTESRSYLQEILPTYFRMNVIDTDRYGRTVGELFDPAESESINLKMVQQGQAAVYPYYCKEKNFFQAEEQAKEAERGIWQTTGLHQKPWAYRRQKR